MSLYIINKQGKGKITSLSVNNVKKISGSKSVSIPSSIRIKDTVLTEDDLDNIVDPKQGDAYITLNDKHFHVYIENYNNTGNPIWLDLGSTIDVSLFATKDELQNYALSSSLMNYINSDELNTALEFKINKVPGTTKRLAQINEDGSLSAASIATNVPAKVMGKDASGGLTEYPTTPYKAVSDLAVNPTLTDLAAYTVDRVDFPNLVPSRIYLRVGNYWKYITLTDA